MKKNEAFYILMVLLGSVLWGTTGTAQYFAPAGASPLSIGAVRLAIGGTALTILALTKGAIKSKEIWLNPNTFISAASVAAYQLFFFAAVLKTGVAMGTVVAIGSAPVFAGIFSILMGKDKPDSKWLLATFVSIIGCILLLTGGKELAVEISGVLLALAAGAAYAGYTAFSKQLLDKYSTLAVTGVVFFIGAILLSPMLFLYDLSWLRSAQGIGVALHLGILATALAYVLFTYGLSGIPLHKAVTLSLTEPATASMLGVFLLKEKLSLISWIGMALVFAGLMIVAQKTNEN